MNKLENTGKPLKLKTKRASTATKSSRTNNSIINENEQIKTTISP